MRTRVLIGFTCACFEDPHIGFTHPTSLIIDTGRGKPVVLGVQRYEDHNLWHKAATHVKRELGRSRLEISVLGLGCWAIGGPFWHDGHPVGWGNVDDTESLRAFHHAH
jgi:hypothetical protein